jgi:hypothetical protein
MAASAAFPSVIGTTPDEELDISEYTLDLRLTAAMEPGSTRVSATLRSPNEINELVEDASRRIVSVENRPAALRLGTLTVVDGVGERPSWDDSVSDESQRVYMEIRDKWRLLEDYRFTDPEVLDGLTLTAAVTQIAEAAGVDLIDISAAADDITIELHTEISSGRFAVQIEPRDTAAEVLKKLVEQFVPDWFFGIRPTLDGPTLQLFSPAEMGELPLVTLYPEVAQATAASLDPPYNYVFHNFNQQSPPTEFTRLFVIGQDPRNGRPILTRVMDAPREDPTLTFSERSY